MERWAVAHDGAQERVSQQRTVTTRGEGWVDVEPDAATITIGLSIAKPDLAAARNEAAARATAIIAAIKDTGVPNRDIQTSNYRIQVLRDRDRQGNPTVTRGYEVANTVTATVRDLDRLPSVLDAATAAGANQVQGPDFFVQQREDAEDEARRLAMASARRRAEVLATAAGAALGPVRSIVDGDADSGPMPRVAYRAVAADTGPATPIEAGTERVPANVEVVWELG
jgi:uncharacterized protein YggE